MNWIGLIHRASRKTKRMLEWLVFRTFDSVALCLENKATCDIERVAIVHIELLGDFFIWLPYGQKLAADLAADGKREIFLVVDSHLEEIAQAVFCDHKVFPVPRRDFVRAPSVRWHTLRQLRRLGISQCFHPSTPRDALVQDAVVRALGAPAVGFDSVYADRPWLDIASSRRIYQQFVPDIPAVHQQVRHRRFLEAVTRESSPISPAQLPQFQPPRSGSPYLLIAPGGSRIFRQWPPERFAELAERLLERHPEWHCVIIGTFDEAALAEPFARKMPQRTTILCGKTSLLELCAWIANAKLVLCNDSGAGHIAAACGTPSLAITGGGHWGRCYPYDACEAPIGKPPLTVSFSMPCFGCDWVCKHSLREDQPFPCIRSITVEDAWQSLQPLLPQLDNDQPSPDRL